jgi:hypothetical protein
MAINRLVCQCLALSILGTAAFGVQAETQSFKCVYPKYSDHEGIHNAKILWSSRSSSTPRRTKCT